MFVRLENLRAAVTRPCSPHYREISEIISTYFSRAIRGELTPEKTVEKMIRGIKAILAAG